MVGDVLGVEIPPRSGVWGFVGLRRGWASGGSFASIAAMTLSSARSSRLWLRRWPQDGVRKRGEQCDAAS